MQKQCLHVPCNYQKHPFGRFPKPCRASLATTYKSYGSGSQWYGFPKVAPGSKRRGLATNSSSQNRSQRKGCREPLRMHPKLPHPPNFKRRSQHNSEQGIPGATSAPGPSDPPPGFFPADFSWAPSMGP